MRTSSREGGRALVATTLRIGSSSSSPAAITPPPITTTCGLKMLTKLVIATPSREPISSITSIAAASPSCASSVTSGPTSGCPSASARPRPECGRSRATRVASRASAVPDAIASMQPWFGQLPWQGGPFSSITMWPSSAAEPIAPWYSSSRRISPPPIPVPIVSSTTSLQPRAAPARCSASAAMFASLSTNTGSPRRSAITSPNAMSASARLIATTAIPVRWSISDGIPKPTAATSATRGLAHLLDRVDGDVEQRGLVQPRQRSLGTAMDGKRRVHRAGKQFRSAHVDADRAPAWHAVTICGTRATSCAAAERSARCG